jgi:hypothetical protein
MPIQDILSFTVSTVPLLAALRAAAAGTVAKIKY